MPTVRIGIDHRPYNAAMREAREARGWSRRHLALTAGLQPGTVGAIEALKQWPNARYAERLSWTLLVPEEILFPPELGAIVRQHGAVARQSVHEVELLSLGDVAPALLAYDPAAQGEEYDRLELASAMAATLDTLTARERGILELRFGIGGGPEATLDEVAAEYNVTRERIRQIEAKALRKLRHPARARRITDFLVG